MPEGRDQLSKHLAQIINEDFIIINYVYVLVGYTGNLLIDIAQAQFCWILEV